MAKKATTGTKAKKAPAAKPKPAAKKVETPIEDPVEEVVEEKDPVEETPEPVVETPPEETPEPAEEKHVPVIKLTYHPTGRVLGFRDGVRMDSRHIQQLAHKAGWNGIINAFTAMKVKRGKTIEGPVDSVLKQNKKK